MDYDVLIPAHGESVWQIETLLMAIYFQRSIEHRISRVFLCSDNLKLKEAFQERSFVSFIAQDPGCGKPAALNLLLQKARANLCIQISADCLPASENTFHYLISPFMDSTVGAVTSYPVPSNSGFMYLPNIIWKCHDFVQPKLNAELFSFKRDLIGLLPETVIHDDAYIHNLILSKHHQVVYEPRAVVFNSAPKTLREFYIQRNKNVIGNLQLAKEFHQDPPKHLKMRSLILMGLELLANVHGRMDYVRKHIPKGLIGYNLESTKEVMKCE